MSDDREAGPAESPLNRRPLRVRELRIVRELADYCAKRGIRPNQVSLASMAGAGLAAAGILMAGRSLTVDGVFLGVVLALAGIFLRVMANLIDGMIAVEGGFRTPSGEIYNDVPDRVSDSVIFIAMGYGALVPWAGWLAALLAMMTAYVRLLGGACGLKQSFAGPMAKPHRMAVTACALLALLVERSAGGTGSMSLLAGLAAINAGAAFTVWRRLARIVRELECRS